MNDETVLGSLMQNTDGIERGAAYAGEMQAAVIAAAELAASWSADPAAAAAVIRNREAQKRADAPAPDSCTVLEALKASYATYAELRGADPEAIRRFEAAERAYDEALRRLERTL